jgi:predicted SAM-dependent methyltransferase
MHWLEKAYRELSWAGLVLWRRVKRKALASRRFFLEPKLPRNSDGKVYIHLGCGAIAGPEFINVDICPAPHVHFVRDVSDLSVFPDRYADLVYACHLLEHLNPGSLRATLGEWRRVLKEGGLLRLSVPDFDKLVGAYEACGRNVESIAGPLLGGWGPYKSHGMVFNARYLQQVLLEVGFTAVREWDPAHVKNHDFEDWASRHIRWDNTSFPVSLNLEGVR